MIDKGWRKRLLGNRQLSPETLMMGYGYDPFLSERSLKPPVFHTSTFVFRTAQDGKEFFELAYGLRQKRPNEEPGLIYSRINNPDLEILEDRLAIWDEAEANLAFASGMAAISTCLWAYVRPGTVIVHSGPVYGGTDFLLNRILPQFGVNSVGFPAEGGTKAMEEAVDRARALGSIAALYIETPANPTNGLVDIRRAREITDNLRRRRQASGRHRRQHDAGPSLSDADTHGADLVVTSLTKYVGGHSDLIAGGCSGTPWRSSRSAACARSWGHVRSSDRLDVDAVAGDDETQNAAAAEGARKMAKFLAGHPRSTRSGIWVPSGGSSGPRRFSSASAREAGSTAVSKSKAARRKPSPCSIDSR